MAEFLRYVEPEAWRQRLEARPPAFVAEQGEDLVGVIEGRGPGRLALVVAGDQRQGVGRELLRLLVEEFRPASRPGLSRSARLAERGDRLRAVRVPHPRARAGGRRHSIRPHGDAVAVSRRDPAPPALLRLGGRPAPRRGAAPAAAARNSRGRSSSTWWWAPAIGTAGASGPIISAV